MEKQDMEKKVDALLEGKQAEEKDNTQDGSLAEEKEQETVRDPGEQLRRLCRGKLTLLYPFRSHSQDVKEIGFDFCELTGAEMMDALDSVNVNNMFAVSNNQALALFAATAEKCAPMIEDGGRLSRLYDAKDVKTRLGAADAVKAIQLAKLFYNASGQAGNLNISK